MASGPTTTGSLADSADLIIDSGRIRREYEGTFMRVCDWNTLPENTGLSWEEVLVEQLEQQAITETTWLNNPQQLADSLLTITPSVHGIQIRITDRVYRRLSKKALANVGELATNAIQRGKDEDYLSTLDGATVSTPGTGATLTSGHISAMVRQITSNATEPSLNDPIFVVLHGYQIHDIQSEFVSGVGTYPIPAGMTEQIFRQGYRGQMFGASFFEDGNITIDSTVDSKGGVHSKMAIVGVQGHKMRKETKRLPDFGGGADDMFMYDEWAFGERSAGNWLKEIYSNTTAPTS